jgi:hypothetical protein
MGDQSISEIDRNSKPYIQWYQTALNKFLGIRYPVDGIMGAQTRKAIERFQEIHGLVVDGIFGPQTECALVLAGAGKPPGGIVPSQSFSTTQTLRQKVSQLAIQEWIRWDKGVIKESEPGIRSVLEDYWCTGVQMIPSEPDWWTECPWSAVFISWIMRKAGAGNTFAYSQAHTDYVGEAKLNRLANNNNPFKAYRINEVAPRIGDLVCKERDNSGVTYDNVDQGFFASHCDIVTAVKPGLLHTTGGNVSDSVSLTTVEIDGNGRISEKGYYAVVRVGNSDPGQLTS